MEQAYLMVLSEKPLDVVKATNPDGALGKDVCEGGTWHVGPLCWSQPQQESLSVDSAWDTSPKVQWTGF